jgi:hypothetical protein
VQKCTSGFICPGKDCETLPKTTVFGTPKLLLEKAYIPKAAIGPNTVNAGFARKL